MLGPLQQKRNAAPAVRADPNISQFKALVPNAFATPELPLPFTIPEQEELQRQERIAAVWRRHAPEIFNARQELDQAEAAFAEAFRIHRERQTAVMTCKDRLSNASDEIMGQKDDCRSNLAISEGYAAVAEHNAAWASERLREAREKLAAATAPALVKR